MSVDSPQPLALTLAATASSWLGIEEHEPELRDGFARAVAAMHEADREYRRTIEATLPPEDAGAMLSAMIAFRERVRQIRDRARGDIGELYRRCGVSYGWFDPLGTFVPPTTGLSHADGTRVATASDAARSEVATLRAQVNAAVAKRLTSDQIDVLIAAKRRRAEAFEAALEEALEIALAPHPAISPPEREKTLYRLTELTEGWY
jgi:hypothetical protein